MNDGRDNVTQFPYPQELTTVETALRDANESDLTDVLIIGFTGEDHKIYIRSSGDVTNADALFLIEHARMAVLGLGIYAKDDTE
jgi:hypothetical protein